MSTGHTGPARAPATSQPMELVAAPMERPVKAQHSVTAARQAAFAARRPISADPDANRLSARAPRPPTSRRTGSVARPTGRLARAQPLETVARRAASVAGLPTSRRGMSTALRNLHLRLPAPSRQTGYAEPRTARLVSGLNSENAAPEGLLWQYC